MRFSLLIAFGITDLIESSSLGTDVVCTEFQETPDVKIKACLGESSSLELVAPGCHFEFAESFPQVNAIIWNLQQPNRPKASIHCLQLQEVTGSQAWNDNKPTMTIEGGGFLTSPQVTIHCKDSKYSASLGGDFMKGLVKSSDTARRAGDGLVEVTADSGKVYLINENTARVSCSKITARKISLYQIKPAEEEQH